PTTNSTRPWPASRTRASTTGPTPTTTNPARSTTCTTAEASTSTTRAATTWRFSPTPMSDESTYDHRVDLPVMPPVKPMLARAVHEVPHGPGLSYEPKWDGFRCIVFRDGDEIELGSRNDRPLTRYFPELLDPLRAALPQRCVVDGEVVIAGPEGLDFDALQLRLHPAESRVRKLAGEIPAS